MVAAARSFVRIVIRRPHAYWFLDETFRGDGGLASANPGGVVTLGGGQLPLPGLYVLDPAPDGAVLGSSPLSSVEAVGAFLRDLAPPPAADRDAAARISFRVHGFVASAGIT